MMPIINVPTGAQARGIHVQQIINWLRGLPSYSEPVSFTGITNDSAYALTVANAGVGGKGFRVRNSLQTVTLLESVDDGTVVRANASTGTYFRVRNFADNGDLFAVTNSGVSLGGETIATLTGTQTLTNKTLTAPNFDGPIFSNYAELLNQASPPSNPTAGRIRIYETSNTVRFVDSTGTIRQLATLDGTETLQAKTIQTPIVSSPNITGYIDLSQAAEPAAPGAGNVRLYSITGESLIKVRLSNGTIKELVDLDSVQSLSNKTISGLSLSGAILTAPNVTNYVEMDWSNTPGGAASKSRLWAKNDNNLYYTLPSGTVVTVTTSLNTPSLNALGFSRMLALSGG